MILYLFSVADKNWFEELSESVLTEHSQGAVLMGSILDYLRKKRRRKPIKGGRTQGYL